MEKKIALILAGSGVKDGSEIHETVALMLAITKAGYMYEFFAPNIDVATVNHLTGEVCENRNVLEESARIARGDIQDLKDLKIENFLAIVIPGGFGAAGNLCNYGAKGSNFEVIPALESVLLKASNLKKPIGAMCIAPVILAKVFPGAVITLGGDNDATKDMKKIGANPLINGHGEVAVDKKYRLASVPGYMLDANLIQIFEDADKLIYQIGKLISENNC